jgi:hypothetical protein
MNAALMSFQAHESGIHAVWSGAGEVSVTEVRFRCTPRAVARRGRTRINLSRRVRARAVNSGSNRMSLTKDRMTTSGDHALVFSEFRRVTCGRVVQKAVDNRRDMRITGGILWTTCGPGKKSK